MTSIEERAFGYCDKLENVYCYAEIVPYTRVDAFRDVNYATLHVPASAIDAYKSSEPWSEFETIKAIEGTEVETKKCETPTITFNDNKLSLACATEDVEFVTIVESDDINTFYTDEVTFYACYEISVIAKKTGYKNSETATAKLYWMAPADKEDNINMVEKRGVVVYSAGGNINISGLANDERVDFYDADGKTLGSATAVDGSVFFSAQTGTIVIAMIGKESIKIVVR